MTNKTNTINYRKLRKWNHCFIVQFKSTAVSKDIPEDELRHDNLLIDVLHKPYIKSKGAHCTVVSTRVRQAPKSNRPDVQMRRKLRHRSQINPPLLHAHVHVQLYSHMQDVKPARALWTQPRESCSWIPHATTEDND